MISITFNAEDIAECGRYTCGKTCLLATALTRRGYQDVKVDVRSVSIGKDKVKKTLRRTDSVPLWEDRYPNFLGETVTLQ